MRSLPLVVAAALAGVAVSSAPARAADWTSAGSLSTTRYDAAAAPLPDGGALLEGGSSGSGPTQPLNSVDRYRPESNSWSPAAPMSVGHWRGTATALADGRVLVAGGQNSPGLTYVKTAELYDPASNTWSSAGALHVGRAFAGAVRLQDGSVLVVGGDGADSPADGAEIYDPATNAWTTTGPMRAARSAPAIAVLHDGRVLVAGGWNEGGYLSSAEIFDPAIGEWSDAASMGEARHYAGAATLPDGRVLVAGGVHQLSSLAPASDTAEIYDPVANTWTPTANMSVTHGEGAQMVVLQDGEPMIVGGFDTSGYSNVAELFDPASGTWTAPIRLQHGRSGHSAVVLASGVVLVAGGFGAGTGAERYGAPPVVEQPPGDQQDDQEAPQQQPGVTIAPPPPAAAAVTTSTPHPVVGFVTVPKRLIISKTGAVAIKLRCDGAPACSVKLALRQGKKTLASRTVTLRGARATTVHLDLSARTRRTLGHRIVHVTFTAGDRTIKATLRT